MLLPFELALKLRIKIKSIGNCVQQWGAFLAKMAILDFNQWRTRNFFLAFRLFSQ